MEDGDVGMNLLGLDIGKHVKNGTESFILGCMGSIILSEFILGQRYDTQRFHENNTDRIIGIISLEG